MHFANPLRVRLDPVSQKVSVSVQVAEDVVVVKQVSLGDFQVLVAQFQEQLEDLYSPRAETGE
jgi:hypothetical protein